MSSDPVSILITGASSGLGAALALDYARQGTTLFLSGRNADRLEETARACRARGALVFAETHDVTAAAAMAAWVEECDRIRPLDLVIANAGISGGTGGHDEPAAQARAIFAVNVDGVVNTVLPALGPMRARRAGQVAIISSLASFRGFAGAPAYCASKAAVRVWGESLRGWLAAEGVSVSVVCPGFVATPMTAVNSFRMPLLMTADRAATIIRRGLAKRKGRIAFPFPLYALAWLSAALPPRLMDLIGRFLPAKG